MSAAKAAKEDAAEDESTRYLRLMADFQNYKKRWKKKRKIFTHTPTRSS